jgi:hypothetical protein
MKSKLFLASALLSVMLITGCARKVVVVRPVDKVEVVPFAPSPQHIWVKGHYLKRGRNYVWVPGYYITRHRSR